MTSFLEGDRPMALFGFLEALQEKTGEDVFVATYYATKQKDTGVVTSYSTWSEGSSREETLQRSP